MKGSEFIKKLKKLGDCNGVEVKYIRRCGKGSHGTLFYGERYTIIPNHKNELKKGTLQAIIKQLGLKGEKNADIYFPGNINT